MDYVQLSDFFLDLLWSNFGPFGFYRGYSINLVYFTIQIASRYGGPILDPSLELIKTTILSNHPILLPADNYAE